MATDPRFVCYLSFKCLTATDLIAFFYQLIVGRSGCVIDIAGGRNAIRKTTRAKMKTKKKMRKDLRKRNPKRRRLHLPRPVYNNKR